MSAIDGENKKVCIFNTFDNNFKIKELIQNQFIDSENNQQNFILNEDELIEEIKERIIGKSKEKWWIIGEEITLLKIDKNSFNFLLNFDEDLGDFSKIKWRRINPQKLVKYK